MYSNKLLFFITFFIVLLGVSPYPQIYFQFGFYLLVIAVGLSLLVSIPPVMQLKQVKRTKHLLINLFIVFSFLGAFGGVAVGNDIPRVVKELLIFLSPIVFYILLINTFPLARGADKTFFKVLLFLLIVLCTLQLVYYPIGFLNFSSRYKFRHDYVLFSSVFLLLFPVALLYVKKGLNKALLGLLFSVVIILTLSRDFQLYIFLLFFSFFLYNLNRSLARLYVLSLCLFPFIYIGLAAFLFQSGNVDKSSMWRFIELISYGGHILNQPSSLLIGEFFGSYLKTIQPIIIFGEEIDEIPRFHNFWLYLSFKLGIVASLSFYFCAAYFVNSLTKYSKLGYYSGFILAYMLFVNGSFWGSFTQIPAVSIMLAFILYISKKVIRDERFIRN
ncbi:hypothetical protein JL49_20910 [Pseudoalteromonas luteoviolacea]|nr:hypothetical protein JL49_20910 [Pseudoalteromonas luteoviolacea]